MTMVIFFLSPVDSCGSHHGRSSRKEEVCPSSPTVAMSIDLGHLPPPSVESCGVCQGIYSSEEEVCPPRPKTEGSMTMAIFLLSLV